MNEVEEKAAHGGKLKSGDKSPKDISELAWILE
jgi:hypothetical protein